METYRYAAGPETFRLPMARYEQHLLSRVEPRDASGWGVLAVHRGGIEERRSREALIERARNLLAVLERDDSLLQFRYGLRERGPDGSAGRLGSGGGRTCRLQGEAAIAEAGPGFAHIVASTFITVSGVTRVHHRVLHDLRDLRPVRCDDGLVLQAHRRTRRVDLIPPIRSLLAFLTSQELPLIVCSVAPADDGT